MELPQEASSTDSSILIAAEQNAPTASSCESDLTSASKPDSNSVLESPQNISESVMDPNLPEQPTNSILIASSENHEDCAPKSIDYDPFESVIPESTPNSTLKAEVDPEPSLMSDSSSSDSDSESSSSSSSSFYESLLRKNPIEDPSVTKPAAFKIGDESESESSDSDDSPIGADESLVNLCDIDESYDIKEGPPRSRNEKNEEILDPDDLKTLIGEPRVLLLPPSALQPLGHIMHIVDDTVVIKSEGKRGALDLDSLVVLEDGRVLGRIYDTFGPVEQPLYSIRFATKFVNQTKAKKAKKAAKKAKVAKEAETIESPESETTNNITESNISMERKEENIVTENGSTDVVGELTVEKSVSEESKKMEASTIEKVETDPILDDTKQNVQKDDESMDIDKTIEQPTEQTEEHQSTEHQLTETAMTTIENQNEVQKTDECENEGDVETTMIEVEEESNVDTISAAEIDEYVQFRKKLLSSLSPLMKVFFVLQHSNIVFPEQLYEKGYDASDWNDEELPREHQEFSDDEAELQAQKDLKQRKKRKRGEAESAQETPSAVSNRPDPTMQPKQAKRRGNKANANAKEPTPAMQPSFHPMPYYPMHPPNFGFQHAFPAAPVPNFAPQMPFGYPYGMYNTQVPVVPPTLGTIECGRALKLKPSRPTE